MGLPENSEKIARSKESSKKSVNHCIVQPTYLGDNAFISAGQNHIGLQQSNSIHITKRSKKSPKKSMDKIVAGITDRREARNAIYKTGYYTMFEIATYFNVHYRTVS